MWPQILTGAGVGLGFGLVSWFKSAQKDGKIEKFEVEKLPYSIISGAVAGVILGATNQVVSFDAWETAVLSLGEYAGLTVAIEYVAKIIQRRLISKFFN